MVCRSTLIFFLIFLTFSKAFIEYESSIISIIIFEELRYFWKDNLVLCLFLCLIMYACMSYQLYLLLIIPYTLIFFLSFQHLRQSVSRKSISDECHLLVLILLCFSGLWLSNFCSFKIGADYLLLIRLVSNKLL